MTIFSPRSQQSLLFLNEGGQFRISHKHENHFALLSHLFVLGNVNANTTFAVNVILRIRSAFDCTSARREIPPRSRRFSDV